MHLITNLITVTNSLYRANRPFQLRQRVPLSNMLCFSSSIKLGTGVSTDSCKVIKRKGQKYPQFHNCAHDSASWALWRFSKSNYTYLKALDTFGNCQRLSFSLGVSQHNIGYNWSSKLRENSWIQNTLVAQVVCFQSLNSVQILF